MQFLGCKIKCHYKQSIVAFLQEYSTIFFYSTMTSITLFARWKYQNLIYFNFIFVYISVELAMIMDRLYGGVCYAGIDTDPELKYPKGAGRVAFSNQQSYIAAISARFVQLQHGEIDKRVCISGWRRDSGLFWTSLEDQFFMESLHNAYRTVIEKYFNSSHSNVPIKFGNISILYYLD